jgi:hypothetical protein
MTIAFIALFAAIAAAGVSLAIARSDVPLWRMIRSFFGGCSSDE